ncbi:MAG: hypothetical protein U5R48_13760 [Gammaproteobacteria bacterium]|nr:hypothetical protein [Gammaproteobacteria bacterium]
MCWAVHWSAVRSSWLTHPAFRAPRQPIPAIRRRDASRRCSVTAERRESSITDTAISISAFDSDFLDNFNIRNQEDLQNYIPATTIQPYDASIRGDPPDVPCPGR